MSKQVHLRVTGIVQGVGYRYFIQDRATELGVAGIARNRSDGSVEVEAMGTEQQLQQLIAAAKQGPGSGLVDAVEIEWSTPSNKWYSFEIE